MGRAVSEETRAKISKANKGRKHTEEQRRINSEAHKGIVPSEEQRRKQSASMKANPNVGKALIGRKLSEETKRKISASRKGKPKSTEHRKKIGDVHRGKIVSEETRKKMSDARIGKKLAEETKRKMSDGRRRGENHPNWMGKDHNRIYPPEFFRVRNLVLNRDGDQCWNPGCWGTAKRMSVHHIDFDKNNNRLTNLIALCMSCNNRANKGREFWTAYYQKLMRAKSKPEPIAV